LLEHNLYRRILKVRRIAVLPQDFLDQHPHRARGPDPPIDQFPINSAGYDQQCERAECRQARQRLAGGD
jgi:hypothetical protein